MISKYTDSVSVKLGVKIGDLPTPLFTHSTSLVNIRAQTPKLINPKVFVPRSN